jgi:tetratricopeptide (TPR) repeat protein
VVAIQYLGAVAEARPEDYVTQLRLARASRQAGRPSRQAGALLAAADAIASATAPDDEHLVALRYRAARAHEAAGNLDQADSAYADILGGNPGHALSHRGRLRIKERKREGGLAHGVGDLETAAQQTSVAAERAAYLTIAADLHERHRDYERALELLNLALAGCPDLLPALHAKARLLERRGPESAEEAIRTLCDLAERVRVGSHRAAALTRAGTLALLTTAGNTPNPRAWELFSEALRADPGHDRAFRGLRRTLSAHGSRGAPPLSDVLAARLADLRERGLLDASALREISRLGDVEGPNVVVELLRAGLDVAPNHAGLRVDLAAAYARLRRFKECMTELEAALAHESAPERRAALHYHAGDASERAGDAAAAIGHYLAAGRAGFHPRHALTGADRVAASIDDLPHRVEALQMLVEVGDGPERVAGLHALAELHRARLGQPDVAVERMRELLLLRPTDVDVVVELVRLLETLDRRDEARAALVAAVAHHRAWLRSSGLRADAADAIGGAPVAGLLRLFEAIGDGDGVYLATGVLEAFVPDLVPEGLACDALVPDPWPLPRAHDRRPFDSLVGDLPASVGLDLLRDGIALVATVPDAPPPDIDVKGRRSLPSNSAVVMVTRALAKALGVPEPRVFVDPRREDGVRAHAGEHACLVVGRRINSAPFGPSARDVLSRALFRLATGGDVLHDELSEVRLFALMVALARAAGSDVPPSDRWDDAYAERVTSEIQLEQSVVELGPAADAFVEGMARFDAREIRATLRMAEDRAAVVGAADPRPTLVALAPEALGPRGTALVSYLLSDDHLALRRGLGYVAEIPLHGRRREASV